MKGKVKICHCSLLQGQRLRKNKVSLRKGDKRVRRTSGHTVSFIVPEQYTMQTQKELVRLHPRHGLLNIDVLSFKRLAYRVFEDLGVQLPQVLDDMGKSMVIRKVAGKLKKN